MSETATSHNAHDENKRGALVPVPPSIMVRTVMGPMTKLLNPIIVTLAGRRHFAMAAQIRHRGRRSGKAYLTPVTARIAGDAIWVALTFGNQSDWSRNVRAAGECTIRIAGQDIHADNPQFINRADAGPALRTAFKPAERAMFRILGIKQFLRLQAITANPGDA
jgi:deazaflavin-dependent oxidoreductase (nitroreductase family)